MNQRWLDQIARNPEANFLLFSFLFNFVWEMWQVSFYEGFATLDHMAAVRTCTQASLGDAVISVIAFWGATLAIRSRQWIYNVSARPMIIYLGVGLTITVFMEWLATEILDRWQYAANMPELPILGTGLLPLLQWIILPPIILLITRQQTIRCS